MNTVKRLSFDDPQGFTPALEGHLKKLQGQIERSDAALLRAQQSVAAGKQPDTEPLREMWLVQRQMAEALTVLMGAVAALTYSHRAIVAVPDLSVLNGGRGNGRA